MKNFIRLFLLFLGISIQAQIADLQSLATGDFVHFSPIFNQQTEKLEGYLSLYLKGEASKEYNNFEAVILDQNLNTVFTKEFHGEKLVTYYSPYIKDTKLILKPYTSFNKFSWFTNSARQVSMFGYNKRKVPSIKEINLQTGDISTQKRYYVKNGKFFELEEGQSIKALNETMKNEDGKSYDYDYTQLKNKQYFVVDHSENGKNINSHCIKLFGKDRNLIWKYEYAKNNNKKNKKELIVVGIDEKNIFAMLYEKKNRKMDNIKFLIFDTQTSKKIAEKDISNFFQVKRNKLGYFSIFSSELYDNKLTLIGFNTDENNFSYIGYKAIMVDRKTNNISYDNINYLSFKPKIPKINKKGQVEGGMYLRHLESFITKDGNVNMILEKYRPQGGYAREKTTDLVLVSTTPSFKLKNVEVIKKEKSKGFFNNNDYLFGQMLEDDSKVVFFYQDKIKNPETNKKNWMLYINKISKDGNYQQEIMQMSSKKDAYFIYPYIAKEGYILLREFNKKEKYNAIRLEKLNL